MPAIRTCLGFALGTALLTSPVAAKDPVRLAPSSQWIVSYDEDSCRLVRAFGEGDDKVFLTLSRFGPGDGFHMTLASQLVRRIGTERAYYFRFGDHEPAVDAPFFTGDVGDEQVPALIWQGSVRVDRGEIDRRRPTASRNEAPPVATEIAAERYAAISYIGFGRIANSPDLILNTGSMQQPFAALSTCTDELLSHWGIDVARHKSLTRPVQPANKTSDWVRSGDYPTKMLQEGQPALVDARLSVDAQGSPTACHIQRTTRPKEFDNAVCNGLMRKAKFLPALDGDGQPMPSYYRLSVTFTIE